MSALKEVHRGWAWLPLWPGWRDPCSKVVPLKLRSEEGGGLGTRRAGGGARTRGGTRTRSGLSGNRTSHTWEWWGKGGMASTQERLGRPVVPELELAFRLLPKKMKLLLPCGAGWGGDGVWERDKNAIYGIVESDREFRLFLNPGAMVGQWCILKEEYSILFVHCFKVTPMQCCWVCSIKAKSGISGHFSGHCSWSDGKWDGLGQGLAVEVDTAAGLQTFGTKTCWWGKGQTRDGSQPRMAPRHAVGFFIVTNRWCSSHLLWALKSGQCRKISEIQSLLSSFTA